MADPGGAEPRRCLLSHYRSLDPRALAAVKALRDHYVSDAQTSSPGDSGPARVGDAALCREGPWHPSLQQVHPHLRVQNSDHETSLVTNITSSKLWSRLEDWRPELVGDSILRLYHLPPDPPPAPAGVSRLLEEVPPATQEASPNTKTSLLRLLPGYQHSSGCHEAGVIFNLLRLLTWDLRLVAHPGPCV
ncbi:interferon lambda-4-like [Saccopteryx leptura]|uniref:interferon lambda-4-like n=1 Tax=Saccopteryx leptura TaxID=249018 RepID=UPI00339C1711